MPSTAAVKSILTRVNDYDPIGFAIALHVQFTRPKFLFQSYDRAWLDEYSKRGMVMRDPTVQWGMANEGWVRWSALDDQGDVLDAAAKHGLRHGIAAAHVNTDSRSFGSMASSQAEFDDAAGAGFHEIVKELHDAASDLSDEDVAKLRRMSIVGVQVS